MINTILNLVELFKHCASPARPSRVLSVLLSLLLLLQLPALQVLNLGNSIFNAEHTESPAFTDEVGLVIN